MRASIIARVTAGVAAVLLLAGCSSSVQGSAQAGSTIPSSSAAPTTETSVTETSTEEQTTSEEQTTTEEETTTEDETTTSEETDSGGSSGLDPVTQAWFETFCVRVADAGQYVTEVNNVTLEEAQSTIVDTYTNISLSASTSVGLLQQIPAPQVDGGDDLASKALEYFSVASDVYGRGALTILALTPASFDDLQAAKDAVEAEATASIPDTMSAVDPAVLAAAQQLPECQSL